MSIGVPEIVRDAPGAGWEKRGNTLWIGCTRCKTWFPVSPVLTRPGAPAARPGYYLALTLNSRAVRRY